MTHIKGSKCAMISRALSTSASPSRSRRGRVVSARLYSVQTGPKPCRSAPETSCSPSSGCRTGLWAQISTRCPGRRPPSPPPRRPCPPTWCRRKAPGVSAFLKSKITATATTKKTRVFIGPDFFPTDKKRSNEACTRAGRSDQCQGGKVHVHRGLPSGRAGVQGGRGGAVGARQLPGRRGQDVCFASNTDLELWTDGVEQGVIDNMIVFQKPFPGAARTELESQLQRAVKVSAKGKHVKCKMDLERCLFWDPAGKRVPRGGPARVADGQAVGRALRGAPPHAGAVLGLQQLGACGP